MSVAEERTGAESGGLVRRRRRRRWSEAQKRQIVAETHEPGVSVPMVAQRYNLNANQIFGWRRLFREPERTAGTGPVRAGCRQGGTGPRGWCGGDAPTIRGRRGGGCAGDGPALARVIAVLERR